MRIIGEKVIHKGFGKGIVTEYKEDHISVYFNEIADEKKFVYPDAFEKFLSFESSDLQDQTLDALVEKKKKKAGRDFKKARGTEKKSV